MIIKVCGMKDAENVKAVEALGIDWMGFVFYEKSPRNVEQIAYVPKACKRVGVFVDPNPQTCFALTVNALLDIVQLHGHETPTFCENFRASLADQCPKMQIIKALAIETADDLAQTAAYEGKVDYFLFDTKCTEMGGSGRVFNWDVLQHYHGQTPFILSGGIGPDSLDALRRFQHPKWVGIDLNSQFETAPGMKDVEKLREFINQVNK